MKDKPLMNKAIQKSIFRQGMKQIKRARLWKFCRPRSEMFELYKLQKAEAWRANKPKLASSYRTNTYEP